VVVPVVPQELTQICSALCELKMFELVGTSDFITRQLAARFHVVARIVGLCH
jgi:hypothetical protein